MKPTQQLHDLGQSLWLDDVTHGLLANGTLRRYTRKLSVTGLTSNPTIFDKAIKEGYIYDAAIRQKTVEGKSGEALFFELALEDLIEAADSPPGPWGLWSRCTKTVLSPKGRSGISIRSISEGEPQRIVPELESTDETGLAHDSSTNALMRRYRRLREQPS